MKSKLRKMLRNAPEPIQKAALSMRTVLRKAKGAGNRIRHIGFGKKAQALLAQNGIRELQPYGKWKTAPVYTQYYTGLYQGKRVFIKVNDEADYGNIEREAAVLKRIAEKGSESLKSRVPDCPLYGRSEDGKLRFLVTGLLEGCDPLGEELSKEETEGLNAALWETYTELGELGIIHADIRPVNILRSTSTGSFCLIDFGMSYLKDREAADEIYGRGVLPYALRRTGVEHYTQANGVFDDAYAILQTLKDLYPNFKKDFKPEWRKWNLKIGVFMKRLEIV